MRTMDVAESLSTAFRSIINHTCNEGYRLMGESQRECLRNGKWSAALPTCECK